ncbi:MULTISPECIES: hypothetical protein [unclassified Mesorhizobium]|uniref:hypothetical protein n=1 Tax=unclassified Mesorhizobium TaxID=325217 RepID=UPI001FE1FAFA|nr:MULTISPECIES: hypothetical protein [unclassified Mesorhizobium]
MTKQPIAPDSMHVERNPAQITVKGSMAPTYLNHRLECPYCLIIKLRIPDDARPDTLISCDDCGEYLGTWDELQTDFEKQGGQNGVFRLDRGRIQRIR